MAEKNIYTKRIVCLDTMLNNTKIQKDVDEMYVRLSMIEGSNTYNRLEVLQQEYKRLYAHCKDIIKQF